MIRRTATPLLMLLLLLAMDCEEEQAIDVPAAIGEEATISDLAPEGTSMLAYADMVEGLLYVAEGREEEILERYGARQEDDGWRIDRGGVSMVYELLPLGQLNRDVPPSEKTSVTLQDALCTAIPTAGTCLNVHAVLGTGEFQYSWRAPEGGVSYCKHSPGNICEYITGRTGTHRTYKERNCPEGGESAGEQDILICADDSE